MKSIVLASPCRNFCILGADVIPIDPRDGTEKYAITTYVAGGIGKLILIDTHSFTSECYDFPSDEGAWAVMYLKDFDKIILGTCATRGTLHRFDLKTRTFDVSLRVETETYLWNFARAKDGNLYASTFPGCNLLKYDPVKHTLQTACRVGLVEGNLYSRSTYTNADGNILVNAGYSIIQAFHYNVDTGKLTQFGEAGDSICNVGPDYIFVKNGELYKFYHPDTLELILDPLTFQDLSDAADHPIAEDLLAKIAEPSYLQYLPDHFGSHIKELADGRIIGIKGQELFILEHAKLSFIRIPAPAPATGIMTISSAQNGILWGSCEFGQTLFSYDPVTKRYENTSAVANAGGEVYGITHMNGKLFLSSYVGGDHIVYDPCAAWNQYDNVNPRTLKSIAPEMVRPHGKSVIGPDGHVWTGWCASYGVYGGGISRINTGTYEVSSWFNVISEQAIEHITAGRSWLYAITSGEASGLSAKKTGFYLLRLDTDCNIVWRRQFPEGIHLSRVIVSGAYLLVSLTDTINRINKILVFEEETLSELSSITLGSYKGEYEQEKVSEFIPYDLTSVIAFCNNRAFHIQIPDGNILSQCLIEGITQTATVTPDKKIYFAIRDKLYQLELSSNLATY